MQKFKAKFARVVRVNSLDFMDPRFLRKPENYGINHCFLKLGETCKMKSSCGQLSFKRVALSWGFKYKMRSRLTAQSNEQACQFRTKELFSRILYPPRERFQHTNEDLSEGTTLTHSRHLLPKWQIPEEVIRFQSTSWHLSARLRTKPRPRRLEFFDSISVFLVVILSLSGGVSPQVKCLPDGRRAMKSPERIRSEAKM